MYRIIFKHIVHKEKLKQKDKYYIAVFNFLESLVLQVKLVLLNFVYFVRYSAKNMILKAIKIH